MVRPNEIYHQNYPLHPQSGFMEHRDAGFVVKDPAMSTFLNSTQHPSRGGRFRDELPVSTFISEPRIRATQMPELPEFFSKSRSLCKEIPEKSSSGPYRGCPLKPVKDQFPPPSPLMLPPNPLLEKAAVQRLSNRYNMNSNGIMSENVQQRYLFSKRPNYGPLSIPATTTYHPVTTFRNNQERSSFNHEENYSYKFRQFGRHPSDTREPMPKLGQGDARLGGGILFGERKLNSSPNLNKAPGYFPRANYNTSASPPPLTYSSYSPKSPTKSYFTQTKVSRFDPRNPHCMSPQRAPAPIPIGPIPEKAKKVVDRLLTPSPTNGSQSYIPGSGEKHQLRMRSVGTQSEEMYSKSITKPAIKRIPTGPKIMSPNYQLDATAPVFQPTSQMGIRARPVKWKTQCRWTYSCVGDCRYGPTCHWGHEGDEYLDEPGVKHSFVKGNLFNERLNGSARHHQSQNRNSPGGYSVYSTSDGYEVQSDDGTRQYDSGRLPDFSWVGGATNVSSWVGNQGRDNPIYDTQAHQMVNACDDIQDVSGPPNGPMGETDNKDPEYSGEGLKEEGESNVAMVVGEKKNEQLQYPPAADVELEWMNKRVESDLPTSDSEPEKIHGGGEEAPVDIREPK